MRAPLRVALMVTCLVDQFFPEVGEATVHLLRRLGCEVEFPEAQTCCGQPAFNAGHRAEAAAMAEQQVRAFAGYDYVVLPSGSCAGMIRTAYPGLISDPTDLASRTYELCEFLVKVLKVDLRALGARFPGVVTYHSSCHMTRELGVRREPLELLEQLQGLTLKPLQHPELCCGFGGTFSVKLPEVACAMADDKLADVRSTGAKYLVGADCGCLMHLQGRMRRTGGGPRVMHIAQVLEEATR